jgi:hypothetical protein
VCNRQPIVILVEIPASAIKSPVLRAIFVQVVQGTGVVSLARVTSRRLRSPSRLVRLVKSICMRPGRHPSWQLARLGFMKRGRRISFISLPVTSCCHLDKSQSHLFSVRCPFLLGRICRTVLSLLFDALFLALTLDKNFGYISKISFAVSKPVFRTLFTVDTVTILYICISSLCISVL